MKNENIIKKIEESNDWYEMKIWEKEEKTRIYVSDGKYKQFGFITSNTDDVSGRNSGIYRGWGYQANRPGPVGDLMKTIDLIIEETEKSDTGDAGLDR